MSKLNQLQIGANYPNIACREINRRYYDLTHGRKYNKYGDDIISEDWDVLIILDACRSDMFSKYCDLEGKFSTKKSRGSNTEEFLYGNFNNRTLLDTVYTTANPQFHENRSEINAKFYEIHNLWNTDLWDETIGTIHPSDVTEIAKQNIVAEPNKRHIVHYLQPHYPFIGTELEDIGHDIRGSDSEEFNLWGLQMRGKTDLTREEINRAYSKNLELVLDAIEDLLDEISGKIVVTSDHGNLVGERSRPIPIKEWGHPSGIYTSELVEVPWLVIEKGERPEIYAGESTQVQEDVASEVVEDRLKDLGYV